MPDQEERADPLALARRVHRARLVLFFEELGVVVCWNGSATFNIYGALNGEPLDVFATEYPAETVDEAERAIDRHMKGWG